MASAMYIPPLYFKTITIVIVIFTLSVGIAVPNGKLALLYLLSLVCCHSF